MEIIKDLPEVFEDFAEQRQKSFLALKDKGIPVIGSYCTYFPKEIAMAMGEFKEVFIMELPQSLKAEVLDLWKAEILRFKEYLEEKFEVTITEEHVREAVKLENEVRTSLKNLYGVMRHDPAPIKGHNLFRVLYGSGFKLGRTDCRRSEHTDS